MTSFFNKLANQYTMAVQHFMTRGYLDYYKFLYGTPQFPGWFMVQSLFSCYVVHKNVENTRKTKFVYIRQLLTAFLMTYTPREIFAFAFKKPSAILRNPQSIIIFLGIYVLMCIPQIYKIINFFAKFIGIAQGINIARFFTLSLRNIRRVPVNFILPVAVIFSLMDQLIELLFRSIYKYKEPEICNKNTILRASIINTIFWLCTNRNYLTKYIGLHSMYFSALVLALFLSVSNSTFSAFVQDSNAAQQQQRERTRGDATYDDQLNNANLNLLIAQIHERYRKEIDDLNAEIDRLKLELFEAQQKAKGNNNDTNDNQHIKED